MLQGLGGILGAVVGANSNAKAVSKEGKAQQAGLQAAIGEQQREYDTSRSDFAPYMGFGKSALGPLGDLLGLNGGDAASKAIEALKGSPIYQSLFNNGQEAVLQNASATGGIRGGNTQGALADFGRDTLSQVIQQQIASLFGAAGIGQGATGSVSAIGAHTADQISGADIGIGNSKAGVIAGRQAAYNDLADHINKILTSIPIGGF